VYLIPPLLAIVVVIAFQLLNSNQTASDSAAAGAPALAGNNVADLSNPQTEISALGAVDTTDIDRRITFWKERTTSAPTSEDSWSALGDVFDLKGRMTGDITQFLAAQQAYQMVISINSNSTSGHAGNARELATLHDFNGALQEATQTLELNPNALGALGVVFDSSIELGHIPDAQGALTDLQHLIPSPSVSVRQARFEFITGDTSAAVTAAEGAASDDTAAGDLPTNVAFYDYTAAEYQLLAGNLDTAQTDYQNALALLPGYPLALFGEGRVAYARGDLATAVTLIQQATDALPRPDMLAFLGDLYSLSGDSAKATDQYATVDFIASMTASSGAGHVYDREYGLFLSDHDRNTSQALTLATDELAQRQDIYGYDAYAWALHANGRDAEALTAIDKAMALGTADAKIYLHAGLIEIANGLNDQGRAHLHQALGLNPTVSPMVVQQARQALGQ
jgi:tetratricopeptide (TPR) repeat protein